MRDTESIVTSGVQRVFLPGAPTRLPVEARSSQVLARSDISPRQDNMLTLRYRFERAELTNQTNDPGPVGLISAERRADENRRDQDLAVVDNHVIGSAALNEFRFQFARRAIDNDVTRYCAGCWAENRPGILLGKSSVVPSPRTEDRWQFANAVTYLVANKLGDHAFKAGVDVSFVSVEATRTAGHDGIFTFDTNEPFDPAIADTYPTRYFRSEGELSVDLSSRLYTAFFQDQWKPVPSLTLNLGVRWDYEDAIGVAADRDNVAPRIGVAFHPWKDGATSIRGGYGVYYDLALFNALISAESGAHVVQTIIRFPGYPDPFAPRPFAVAGLPEIHRARSGSGIARGRLTQSRLALGFDTCLEGSPSQPMACGHAETICSEPATSIFPILLGTVRTPTICGSTSVRPRGTPGTRGFAASRNLTPAATRLPSPTHCLIPSAIPRTGISLRKMRGTSPRNADRVERCPAPPLGEREPGSAVWPAVHDAHDGSQRVALQHHDRPRRQPRQRNDDGSAQGRREELGAW